MDSITTVLDLDDQRVPLDRSVLRNGFGIFFDGGRQGPIYVSMDGAVAKELGLPERIRITIEPAKEA